ncbi:MAG: HEAT repeat domain-containing protein, partial [Pirellulales bacterium]
PRMSSPADPGNTFPPEGRLPPVEPPSAGFIVQLFVIPALIVIIMFMLGAGIKWLVDRGSDPAAYVEAIQRDNAARWQAAHDLADMLRKSQNESMKRDPRLASQLGDILRRQIDTGRMDEESLKLRIYLCHALGEFAVPEVVDPLLLAARTQRAQEENVVRFSALKALAVFLSGRTESLAERPQIEELLLKSSRDEQPLIRSTAAFALGALGTTQATARLRQMLGDGYPDVRFNAATTLARHGDARAVDVLAEMLEPGQAEAIEYEQEAGARESKRDLILVNALRASRELADKNPDADLDELRRAATTLSRSDLPAGIRVLADELLIELKNRG